MFGPQNAKCSKQRLLSRCGATPPPPLPKVYGRLATKSSISTRHDKLQNKGFLSKQDEKLQATRRDSSCACATRARARGTRRVHHARNSPLSSSAWLSSSRERERARHFRCRRGVALRNNGRLFSCCLPGLITVSVRAGMHVSSGSMCVLCCVMLRLPFSF